MFVILSKGLRVFHQLGLSIVKSVDLERLEKSGKQYPVSFASSQRIEQGICHIQVDFILGPKSWLKCLKESELLSWKSTSPFNQRATLPCRQRDAPRAGGWITRACYSCSIQGVVETCGGPQRRGSWPHAHRPTSHFTGDQKAMGDSNSNVVHTFHLKVSQWTVLSRKCRSEIRCKKMLK